MNRIDENVNDSTFIAFGNMTHSERFNLFAEGFETSVVIFMVCLCQAFCRRGHLEICHILLSMIKFVALRKKLQLMNVQYYTNKKFTVFQHTLSRIPEHGITYDYVFYTVTPEHGVTYGCVLNTVKMSQTRYMLKVGLAPYYQR